MHGLTKKENQYFITGAAQLIKKKDMKSKINDGSCTIDEKVNAKRQPNPLVVNVKYVKKLLH